jgi:hypothetical protein
MLKDLKEPPEFVSQENKPIIIKKVSVDENKLGMAYTYRKDKAGNIRVAEFTVKVSGEETGIIKSKADQLIKIGINRMNNPVPKEEE